MTSDPNPSNDAPVMKDALDYAAARGVVVMGLVYGVLEKFVEGYISTAAREAIGFAVIILLLFAFPQGIFGKKETVKV